MFVQTNLDILRLIFNINSTISIYYFYLTFDLVAHFSFQVLYYLLCLPSNSQMLTRHLDLALLMFQSIKDYDWMRIFKLFHIRLVFPNHICYPLKQLLYSGGHFVWEIWAN